MHPDFVLVNFPGQDIAQARDLNYQSDRIYKIPPGSRTITCNKGDDCDVKCKKGGPMYCFFGNQCLCTPMVQEMDDNTLVDVSFSKGKICYPENPKCGGGGSKKVSPKGGGGKISGKKADINQL